MAEPLPLHSAAWWAQRAEIDMIDALGIRKAAMIRFVAGLLLLTLTARGSAYANPRVSLVNFSGPRNGALTLTFSNPVEVLEKTFPGVPADIDVSFESARHAGEKQKTVILPLAETQDTNEYSIVLQVKPSSCRPCRPGWIEFVRQPSGWLKKAFGFSKPGGYTILGRRSIEVRAGDQAIPRSIKFKDSIRISPAMAFAPPPPQIAQYPELVRAGQVIQYLWSVPLKTGPGKQDPNYSRLGFGDQIAEVRTGVVSVECQGTRDLFLHALSGETSLKTRAVYAKNYVTAFPDLLGYTHATAEIWVKKLRKWVTVDAWEGMLFVDDTGQPLSAEDLRTTPASKIHPVKLVAITPRFIVAPQSGKVSLSIPPFELRDFISTPNGAAAGYLFHFPSLAYSELRTR
ncbi:MAG: hypothetical protein ACTHPD_01890 [Rhizomicrobium sp.]